MESLGGVREEKYVSNKLIFLFLDAHKLLGNGLSPVGIVEAALGAHSADFDAHMTSVVFEALLHFPKQAPIFVALAPVAANRLVILRALQRRGGRHGTKLVPLCKYTVSDPIHCFRA